MDIESLIRNWKKDPDFVRHVGMVLSHYGMVRGTSRDAGKTVRQVHVTPDYAHIEALCKEFEQYPGIYKIAVDACEGTLYPGDPLLSLVVAGDIREHVKPVLSTLLDRIKAEAVEKEELYVAE